MDMSIYTPRNFKSKDQINDHLTRYMLWNSWFIDAESCRGQRRIADRKYELWEPGTGPNGVADHRGSFKTLETAVEANGHYESISHAQRRLNELQRGPAVLLTMKVGS